MENHRLWAKSHKNIKIGNVNGKMHIIIMFTVRLLYVRCIMQSLSYAYVEKEKKQNNPPSTTTICK